MGSEGIPEQAKRVSVVIQPALAASGEDASQQPQQVLVIGQENQTEVKAAGLPAARTTQPHPRHEHARHVKPQLIHPLATRAVGKLEVNPNGQFAWLQDITGVPVAATIADALTKGPPS